MSQGKESYVANEQVYATELNQISKNANDGGGFRDGINAGETISVASVPQAIYIDTSDNEAYLCDGNDTSKLDFAGFAIGDGTDGNPIDLQFAGIVRGFTGLDEGEYYFLSDTAGAISTSYGTYSVCVGKAISTTELQIIAGETRLVAEASDTTRISSDTERTCYGPNTQGVLKSIQLAHDGVVRVSYDRANANSSGDELTLYLDDPTIAIANHTGNYSYTTTTVDVAVHKGAIIGLYGDNANISNAQISVRNFRIKYNLVIESLPQVLVDTSL